MVIFYDYKLFFKNNQNGVVLFEKSFSLSEIKLDYFLSPTNLESNHLRELRSFEKSESIIALSNLDQLFYVEYTPKTNELTRFKSNADLRFNSYHINKNILVGLSKTTKEFKFVFYNELYSEAKEFYRQEICDAIA